MVINLLKFFFFSTKIPNICSKFAENFLQMPLIKQIYQFALIESEKKISFALYRI